MIDRAELRKKLPHGYCKEVAKRAGVGISQVSYYFSYKSNSERVENAVLEILVELSNSKKELLDKII